MVIAKDDTAWAKARQIKGKLPKEAGPAVGGERPKATDRAQQGRGRRRRAKEKPKDVLAC
ncbi:CsbD family protein [Streptomyces sp. NPDC057702]|uniref:CsbD family protein n=1 Tax=unclassified Streptomyces TaxID=2593676 RepID=UPI00367E5B5A